MPALTDMYGVPLSTASRVAQPSRDAGAFRGSIAGWRGPQIHSARAESSERTVIQRRTDDLWANDWAARSGVDAIANNAIGTGLVPQARPDASMLGISPEEARVTARIMEWLWCQWTQEAHAAGTLHFEDLQYLGLRTMLRAGEMLHIPVRLPEDERLEQGRVFSLCVQNLLPQRLMTPADMQNVPLLHDGVELSAAGRPLAYHIATPSPSAAGADAPSLSLGGASAPFAADFTRIPARLGHRPNVFHLFRHDSDEQVRGVSPLAHGIKLFRHLSDALDYELYAQVIAAAFPVYFAQENPSISAMPGIPMPMDGMGGMDGAGEEDRPLYAPISAGSMLYGPPGEKPEVLESKRPSQNFVSFVEIILRAMSASLGIPYESLSKDFSRTNYSSARAALNEAWKLYTFYRQWFARMYCQPLWEMVMEEAYLRGLLTLPKSAPGFYEARRFWCSTVWVGPARGFVDPVKEITAVVMALQNRLTTWGEAWMERGGDFDDALPIMREEARQMADLPPLGGAATPKSTAPQNDAMEEEQRGPSHAA